MEVRVVRIGEGAGFTDPEGEWERLREVSDAGAVLVRPDNHVAFRAVDAPADATGTLTDALAGVLGR